MGAEPIANAPCPKTVPIMAEQFQLYFGSQEAADRAADLLDALVFDSGERLMRILRNGSQLVAGCGLIRPPADGALIMKPGSDTGAPFDTYFYLLEGPKSGMHHPEGILWIRTPERVHVELKRKVSLQEIAPTLLALCDVEPTVKFAYPPIPEVSTICERRQAA